MENLTTKAYLFVSAMALVLGGILVMICLLCLL